ncbi:hypothetical protein PghCCS26_54850 [Paenibacillus glycanilyticus]|uniref:Oligosaccharide repeat unit polymerase n=1 Tax=Paenibacillus glycanilyticus TaxID=126569 RepID=A0ABQ6NUW2_9BACL|nr:O-antigen polymerase [Paenibacillus glycanilyticus]GMK48355.1 hypothetical protein PghCCS26_54850 [Paenibacillus glycanilyticus]
MGNYFVVFCFLLISIILMWVIPKLVKADRKSRLLVYYIIFAECFGIMPRALNVITGFDEVIGPNSIYYIPKTEDSIKALWLIILFNFSFLCGYLFVILQVKAISRRRKIQLENNVTKLQPFEQFNHNEIKSVSKLLILISIPGVLFIIQSIFNSGTMLTNSDIEGTRIDVSGMGPLIFLKEIPLTALLVWFSLRSGKVGAYWWIFLASLISISLLAGVRSTMVTAAVMILSIYLLHNGYKSLKKKAFLLGFGGIIVFYLGWITFFARGNLLKFGGDYWFWVKKAILTNPIDAFLIISRGSFNGFDGLVNIVKYVPEQFSYHYGRFWYESSTIIIPRAIWHDKWDLPFTNLYTNAVFGWSKGGIFVTGPGVLYLDSGLIGVLLGAFMIGAISTLSLVVLSQILRNHQWIKYYCFACCAFFMLRFTFAGGSNDAGIIQRLIIESFIILIVVKLNLEFNRSRKYRLTSITKGN